MGSTSKLRVFIGMVISSSVILAACGSGSSSSSSATTSTAATSTSSAKLQTINVGLTSKTATDWPLYVAGKLGYFAKNGVNVKYTIVGSASGNAQQLAAGSLNIGETSSTQVVEAIQGGAPITYVVNQVITPPYSLLAQKNITSISQLKGKTIIVGGVNDITRVFLDAMLKPNGLAPGQYNLTYAGATSARYAALKSGSVAAALLFPPFDFLAKSQGYSDLGNVQKYLPSFPFDGFAANTSWAKSHSKVLVDFIRAYLEGVKWLYDTSNEAEAVSILKTETNTTTANAQQTYQELFPTLHAFSKTGTISSSSMDKVLNALAKLKQLSQPLPPASKFYDNSYAQQASS